MVTITKLQVDIANNKLIVSATDNTNSYEFKEICIDTQKTFNCKNEESIYATTITIENQEVDTPLTNYEIPFSDIICSDNPETDIFFVWVKAKEYPASGDPYITAGFGVTLSVKNFYDLLLNHISIVADNDCNCNPDCSDVNFMLAWQGFNLSKILQDYNKMIYYWKILHSFGNSTVSTGCGCNK